MKKLIIGLVAFVVVLVGGISIFLATIDADKYRGQVADMLSQQTGRTVKLTGPIKLVLSLEGVTLNVKDASVSNPSWAQKPNMATIGDLDLGVALMPLLDKKLVVTNLSIDKADIDLETGYSGAHNWDMSPAQKAGAPAPKVEAPNKAQSASSSAPPVSIHVDKIAIGNSTMTIRNKDNISVLKVSKMSLGGARATVSFSGEYNGKTIAFEVKTDASDLLNISGKLGFDADLTYDTLKLTAEGTANLDTKKADLKPYELAAGGSKLKGTADASWGGAKPSVNGTLTADKINPADFKMSESRGETASGKGSAPAAQGGAKRLFTADPLGLDGLKGADAALDVKIGEVVLSNGSLQQITGKINLANGLLTISPFEAMLGKGKISGEIKVSGATEPNQVTVAVNAPEIEMQDLLHLAGEPAFLEGKTNLQINIAGTGDSAHAIAGSAVGVMNVISGAGTISGSKAKELSSGLMSLFAPSGSNTLNCVAVRFIIKNGVGKDNGILADTSTTTVSGNGGFDLGQENINLILQAKGKVIKAGEFLPPLQVSGPLVNPGFHIDAQDTVKNVATYFIGGASNSGVPTIATPPAGQNACVYTLEHPATQPPPSVDLTTGVGGLAGKATNQLKNMGGTLGGFIGH